MAVIDIDGILSEHDSDFVKHGISSSLYAQYLTDFHDIVRQRFARIDKRIIEYSLKIRAVRFQAVSSSLFGFLGLFFFNEKPGLFIDVVSFFDRVIDLFDALYT